MIHRLSDGRDLAYAEYGDLHGTPVFFFHGSPGSRLFYPPGNVTKHLGVRLICVDRPGYGRSTFQPARRLLDWPRDITSLANALGFDSFAIAGHSGGGPHTLACAYALPGRVTAAAILSGAGPVDTPGANQGMTRLHQFGFTFGQYIPWSIERLLIGWIYGERAANPSRAIDHDREERPAADNRILDLPEIRTLCIQSDEEAYRQGLAALAWDIRLITRPWGFPLNEIEVPVHVWHGTVDNSTSPAMAQHMAEQIPHSRLTIREGEGHMLLIEHWEEILTALIRAPAAA